MAPVGPSTGADDAKLPAPRVSVAPVFIWAAAIAAIDAARLLG